MDFESGWRELIQHKKCAPWISSAVSCVMLAHASGYD